MNYDGPWSWKATKQPMRALSAEDRAYSATVSRNKKRATDRARTKRDTAKRRAIREKNDAPIF